MPGVWPTTRPSSSASMSILLIPKNSNMDAEDYRACILTSFRDHVTQFEYLASIIDGLDSLFSCIVWIVLSPHPSPRWCV